MAWSFSGSSLEHPSVDHLWNILQRTSLGSSFSRSSLDHPSVYHVWITLQQIKPSSHNVGDGWKAYHGLSLLVSWHLEPSQPHRVISGLIPRSQSACWGHIIIWPQGHHSWTALCRSKHSKSPHTECGKSLDAREVETQVTVWYLSVSDPIFILPLGVSLTPKASGQNKQQLCINFVLNSENSMAQLLQCQTGSRQPRNCWF